jgi:glycosyltransferase involved in cell wall biosynthesis
MTDRRLSPKISVAMAAYNGEKFVGEQLDSIFAQSLLPDEIVICDDASSDATVEKLLAYQRQYPDRIRVYQNEQNLGYAHNFEKAISLCLGEIIVLCDQDDVWFPCKLERINAIFESDPGCGFVFSDAEVTNETLQPKGYNVYARYIRPDLREGKILPCFIHKIYLLGCTAAFRSEYRPYLLPLHTNIWGHDHWIAFIMAVVSRLHMIDEPLMYYRRHSTNAGNSRSWNRNLAVIAKQMYNGLSVETYVRERQLWKDMLQQLLSVKQAGALEQSRAALEAGIAAVEARIDFADKRLLMKRRSRLVRLPMALRLLVKGEYGRYMRGYRTFVKDLIA